MVTKEEFNAALDRMVTKEVFSALHQELVIFQTQTRQNFRDVREDIAGLRKETEFEFDDLLGRVKYLEQKLGIESGEGLGLLQIGLGCSLEVDERTHTGSHSHPSPAMRTLLRYHSKAHTVQSALERSPPDNTKHEADSCAGDSFCPVFRYPAYRQ
jgi:hypothetical protein